MVVQSPTVVLVVITLWEIQIKPAMQVENGMTILLNAILVSYANVNAKSSVFMYNT